MLLQKKYLIALCLDDEIPAFSPAKVLFHGIIKHKITIITSKQTKPFLRTL